jgi:hypothetical protein
MSVDSDKPLWIEYTHIGNEFVMVEKSILHNIKIWQKTWYEMLLKTWNPMCIVVIAFTSLEIYNDEQ